MNVKSNSAITRLLVLSDTHQNLALTLLAVEEVGPVDLIVHLGDVVDDAVAIEAAIDCRVLKLAGNCDETAGVPRELLCSVSGMEFLLTHGDAFNVKAGLEKLRLHAGSRKAQVVLYGHTHLPRHDFVDGVHYINPGTLHPKSTGKSCAVLSIIDHGIAAVDFLRFP